MKTTKIEMIRNIIAKFKKQFLVKDIKVKLDKLYPDNKISTKDIAHILGFLRQQKFIKCLSKNKLTHVPAVYKKTGEILFSKPFLVREMILATKNAIDLDKLKKKFRTKYPDVVISDPYLYALIKNVDLNTPDSKITTVKLAISQLKDSFTIDDVCKKIKYQPHVNITRNQVITNICYLQQLGIIERAKPHSIQHDLALYEKI